MDPAVKTENLRKVGASGGMQWRKSGCGVGSGDGGPGSWLSVSATGASMLTGPPAGADMVGT